MTATFSPSARAASTTACPRTPWPPVTAMTRSDKVSLHGFLAVRRIQPAGSPASIADAPSRVRRKRVMADLTAAAWVKMAA